MSEPKEKYHGMYEAMSWYRSNRKKMDPSMLEKLMSARATIATDSVEYAKEFAEQAEIHNNAHWKRIVLVNEESVRLQDQIDQSTGKSYTDAKATKMALVVPETKDTYRQEYESNGRMEGMKQVLYQINGVLESMKQDIAEFRAIRGDNDKTHGDTR
jgi:hypothetical protein